jgi:hypothetical protein
MASTGWRRFLGRLVGTGVAGGGRVTGKPPSGNGASSFHLVWEMPPTPLLEVAATLEVIDPPAVDRLYFWALQVSFQNGSRRVGGAHTGLQFNPRFPDRRAVNWGGYHEGGGVLDGSVSPLPSSPDDRNTRDFAWQAGRRYRFAVRPSPDRGWRATVTELTDLSTVTDVTDLSTVTNVSDLSTVTETVIRDLWVDADRLVAPMVWSEVFANCEDPSVSVRWTDLAAVSLDGAPVVPRAVRCNYQTHANGGCANTNSSFDGVGYRQQTATDRVHPTGTTLTSDRTR